MNSDSTHLEAKVPIFLLSGFLGSGKTTLLNDLLQSPDLAGTAVIINEYGDTGLDHHFIESPGEEIIELSNGCLCCSIRGQLTDTLSGLPLETLSRVVIEMTGLADPGPLIQSILAHPEISRKCTIGAVITLVDALNIDRQLTSHNEPGLQIALADMIVVSKTDMIESTLRSAEIARITQLLNEHNPAATIIVRNKLVALGTDFLDTAMIAASCIPDRSPSRVANTYHQHHGDSRHNHHSNTDANPISAVTLKTAKPISRRALEAFCELLASAHGDVILRIKGLVSVTGYSGPLVIHGVHQTFHEPIEMTAWPDNDHSTRIVVITRGLDPEFMERLFYGFAGTPAVDTPDETALTENPLSISGNYRF